MRALMEKLIRKLRELKDMAVNKIRKLRKYSQRQERRAASDLGAKVEAASGATKFGGADARRVGELRIECKFTDDDQYRVKLDDLLKLREQAIKGGLEEPVFQLEFRSLKRKYAIVPIREDWRVGPMMGTGNSSINLSAKELLSWMKLQEKPNDAIMRLNFWKDGISLEPPTWAFLVFTWDDYLTKRDEDDSGDQR